MVVHIYVALWHQDFTGLLLKFVVQRCNANMTCTNEMYFLKIQIFFLMFYFLCFLPFEAKAKPV